MKKILLAGTVMTLSLLSACGSQAGTGEDTGNTGESKEYESIESRENEFGQADAEESSLKQEAVILSAEEAFRAVLLNEKPLFYVENNVPYAGREVIYEYYDYLNEIPFNDMPMVTPHFAIVDMDGDTVPEVVLELDNYMGFVILRYKDGEIYGNEVGYRSMSELKEDGSAMGSGSAFESSIGKVFFIGNTVLSCDSGAVFYDSYYSNDMPIDEKTWEKLWTAFEETPSVEWHEFSEEVIEEWLVENPAFIDLSEETMAVIEERQNSLDSLSYLIDLTYDNTVKSPEQYNVDARNYYNSCYEEMNRLYQLCEVKLSDKEFLEVAAEQQFWEEHLYRSLWDDMNDAHYNNIEQLEEQAGSLYYRYGDMVLRRIFRLINLCYGNHFYDITVPAHCFEQEEISVVPEVKKYPFKEAVQMGEMQKLDGILPYYGDYGNAGTWYIVKLDGVEYYYVRYDLRYEEYILMSWAIVDDSYELAGGLKVGMKEEDILALYPDMAVIEFEDDYIYDETAAIMGWNGYAYPHSYASNDNDWDYGGKNYYAWADRFDYMIVADIDPGNTQALHQHLGLLMKDHTVAAITFYYPVVG